MPKKTQLIALAIAAALSLASFTPVARAADDADAGPPTLTLDKNSRIVAYQLKRHTNPQLIAIERNPEDAKFRPVYEALLTRKGLEKKYREEAVAAIAKIDKSDAVTVLLDAVGKVDPEDKTTPRELAGLLTAQKPDALAAQVAKLGDVARGGEGPAVKQAAYAAFACANRTAESIWRFAVENDSVPVMLASIPMMPAKVREGFYPQAREAAEKSPDAATQVAAIESLGSIPGKEADAFKFLADTAQKESGDKQAAAIRAVGRIPASKWPKELVEPLAQAIVKLVEKTPAADRTKPETAQAVQLGNDLAGALDAAKSAPIRKQLRDLAPRVVVVHTLTEQMMFDLHYFTVQAGKPVQVILDNSNDNMPHNFVVTKPGSWFPIALAGGALGQPAQGQKPFVPPVPEVLAATNLVDPGTAEALTFNAPDKPGNYPFVCTYPGHYIKMYGVMQVVADLDEYDKNPVPPKDPTNRQPYKSPKNEGAEGGAGHAEHQH